MLFFPDELFEYFIRYVYIKYYLMVAQLQIMHSCVCVSVFTFFSQNLFDWR